MATLTDLIVSRSLNARPTPSATHPASSAVHKTSPPTSPKAMPASTIAALVLAILALLAALTLAIALYTLHKRRTCRHCTHCFPPPMSSDTTAADYARAVRHDRTSPRRPPRPLTQAGVTPHTTHVDPEKASADGHELVQAYDYTYEFPRDVVDGDAASVLAVGAARDYSMRAPGYSPSMRDEGGRPPLRAMPQLPRLPYPREEGTRSVWCYEPPRSPVVAATRSMANLAEARPATPGGWV